MGNPPSSGPNIGEAYLACDHCSMCVHFFLLAGSVVSPSSWPLHSLGCLQHTPPGRARGHRVARQRTRREARLWWSRRDFGGRKCAVDRNRLHKDAAEHPETQVRGWECGRGEGGTPGPRLLFPSARRFRSIRTAGVGLARRVSVPPGRCACWIRARLVRRPFVTAFRTFSREFLVIVCPVACAAKNT